MSQRILKNENGQYLTVRTSKAGPQLKFLDSQSGGTRVKIHTATTKGSGKKLLAFQFLYQNSTFTPMVVEGISLQLVEVSRKPLPRSSWFEKINLGRGNHYSLQSVVEPGYFLCESSDSSESQGTTLSLSEDAENSVVVTEEQQH